MPMTVVATRRVEARYRGFLASIMLEVAPGVYVAPDMSSGVRQRLWSVLSEWWAALGNGSIVLLFRDQHFVGHVRIQTLGEPIKEIVDADGVLLIKKK